MRYFQKYLSSKPRKKTAELARGFTIVEMLVTISVLAIVASMVLANYPKFSQQLALERSTQEAALSLRQAKNYALAVREYGSVGSGIFPAYGAHFDLDTPKDYLVFADIDGYPGGASNREYDEGEEVEEFSIQTHASITEICGNGNTSPPADCDFEKLDIVYIRPGPDIIITGTYAGGGKILLGDAAITISTPDGEENTIVVWNTGQVSVE